jgi:hypothetical protein
MLVPSSAIQVDKGDETMRSDRFFNGIRRFMAKLKAKWNRNGTITVSSIHRGGGNEDSVHRT